MDKISKLILVIMKNKRTGTNANSFLVKIYDILNNRTYQNIIKWINQGKAFEILNPPTFMNEILPAYFKHKNLSSFIRQLNMYDFHKQPGDSYIFNHPLFTSEIQNKCCKSKGKTLPTKMQKILMRKLLLRFESSVRTMGIWRIRLRSWKICIVK